MNKNQNTHNHSFKHIENNKSFFKLLKNIFSMKEGLNFDIFQYSNSYHEKLAIVYANIRVWKMKLNYLKKF